MKARILRKLAGWRTGTALGGMVAALWACGAGAVDLGAVGGPAPPPSDKHGGRDHRRTELPKGSVWVVNRDQGSLTVFDAGTGKVLGHVATVGAGAHDICIVERAGKAFITAETANVVTIVDLDTLALDTIPVAPLPHHCEPSPDGQTVYVSLASHMPLVTTPQLAAIDTDDYAVTYITTSANPAARTHGPHPSPDGDTIYVAHDIGNEVTGVDAETGDVVLSVAPIARAEEVVATRYGDWLWASSRGDGAVKRIDVDTGAITASVAVGVEPESVMLTPSERILAVSLRGQPASLGFVDTWHRSLLGLVPIAAAEPCTALPAVPTAPSFGDLAVMSRDGRHVFATFDRGQLCAGGVSVVDVRTRQVVASWPYPGVGRPHGIAYTRWKARRR